MTSFPLETSAAAMRQRPRANAGPMVGSRRRSTSEEGPDGSGSGSPGSVDDWVGMDTREG
jgi:hypothetical protein